MIRVLVAARSPLWRARATALLANGPGLELVGVLRTAKDAVERIQEFAPDVLLLGTDFLQGGDQLLRSIRLRLPMPVILLASSEEDPVILSGLEGGAADFFVLPALGEGPTWLAASGELADHIRQVSGRGDQAMRPGPRPRRIPTGPPVRRPGTGQPGLQVIVIGASTGGPRAVQAVLEALPRSLNSAVVVALHMPASFTAQYAERVDRVSRLEVRQAADGDRLRQGHACIVPGGSQADLFPVGDRLHLRLRPRQAGERHAPSVDHLMRSAAANAGAAIVGLILTGMGDDGSAGLAAIRAAGGHTLAEDESTALIFGMPREAIRSGAAMVALPLDEIPAALLERCGTRSL